MCDAEGKDYEWHFWYRVLGHLMGKIQ